MTDKEEEKKNFVISKLRCWLIQARQEKSNRVLTTFRKMLKLNPNDNQGIRFIIPAIKAGKTREEFIEEEERYY